VLDSALDRPYAPLAAAYSTTGYLSRAIQLLDAWEREVPKEDQSIDAIPILVRQRLRRLRSNAG